MILLKVYMRDAVHQAKVESPPSLFNPGMSRAWLVST